MAHYSNEALLARYFDLVAQDARPSIIAVVADELERRGL